MPIFAMMTKAGRAADEKHAISGFAKRNHL
jgi:hypothetical protein